MSVPRGKEGGENGLNFRKLSYIKGRGEEGGQSQRLKKESIFFL